MYFDITPITLGYTLSNSRIYSKVKFKQNYLRVRILLDRRIFLRFARSTEL